MRENFSISIFNKGVSHTLQQSILGNLGVQHEEIVRRCISSSRIAQICGNGKGPLVNLVVKELSCKPINNDNDKQPNEQDCAEEAARNFPHDAGSFPPRANRCFDVGWEQLLATHTCTAVRESGYPLKWSVESSLAVCRQGSPHLLCQTVLSVGSSEKIPRTRQEERLVLEQ